MDISFEQKIRERAYEIWQAAGMGDGMALDNWCAAELDLTPKTAMIAAKAKAPKATASAVKPAKAKAATKTTPALAAKSSVKRTAKTPGLGTASIN